MEETINFFTQHWQILTPIGAGILGFFGWILNAHKKVLELKETFFPDKDKALLDDIEKELAEESKHSPEDVQRLQEMRRQLTGRAVDKLTQRAASLGLSLEKETEEKREQAVVELAEQDDSDSQKAVALLADGQITEALDLLITDAQNANKNAAAQWRLIGKLANGIDVARAIQAFEQAVALAPQAEIWDYIYLARLYILNGATDKALSITNNGLEKFPPNTPDYYVLQEEKADILILKGTLQDALTIRKTIHTHLLAQLDPNNAQNQRNLSVSYDNIGNILVQQGKGREALVNYQQSLEIAQRLVQDNPNNARSQRDLSVSYEQIGNILAQQGKGQEALVNYQQSLKIRQRLAKNDPNNAQNQRDLSVSYEKIGNILAQQGKGQEALLNYQQSLEIRQRLAKDDPNNAQNQRDLSVSYDNIGDILTQQGKGQDALVNYQQSLEIAQHLAKNDLNNAESQRDLSVSYDNIGDILTQQGKGQDALVNYQQSLEIRQRLAKNDLNNAESQRDLAISYAKLTAIPESGMRWRQVADQFEEMERKGILAPVDRKLLELTQQYAEEQEQEQEQEEKVS